MEMRGETLWHQLGLLEYSIRHLELQLEELYQKRQELYRIIENEEFSNNMDPNIRVKQGESKAETE